MKKLLLVGLILIVMFFGAAKGWFPQNVTTPINICAQIIEQGVNLVKETYLQLDENMKSHIGIS